MAHPFGLRKSKKRNFGIAAHVDAGKTTLTSAILFYGNAIHFIGDIMKGNTTTDFMKEEQKRGITIQSAAAEAVWNEHEVSLIDTPGHVDFTMEVERSMRVVDGLILAFGAKGWEPQTGTVWGQAANHKVPVIFFLNKMDNESTANYPLVIQTIRDNVDVKLARIQLPIGRGNSFKGVVDVIRRVAIVWDRSDANGTTFTEEAVPADMVDEVEQVRGDIIAMLADINPVLEEKFLLDEEPTIEEIKTALRAATIARQVFPVICGSAYKKLAVQPVLDAINDYLPSPLDVPPIVGKDLDDETKEIVRQTSPDEPLSALMFKVMTEPHYRVYFVRIYSGTLRPRQRVYNSTRDCVENIQRLVKIQGNEFKDVEEAEAGDIVGIIGFKETRTGDTLCDRDHPLRLESIHVPEAVVEYAIEAKNANEMEKLQAELEKLCLDDPSFRRYTDEESGQTIVAGMGELHVEVKVNLMKEKKIEATLGAPQVRYRETATQVVEAEGVLDKQTGGKGMYAKVKIRMEPLPRGAGFQFENETIGGTVPKEFIPSVEKGIVASLNDGVIAGYPVVDLKVTLIDGKHHAVDSNDMAFQLAARDAFKKALTAAGPVLLEPIMNVVVDVPSGDVGGVTGDIASRRGNLTGTEDKGGRTAVMALVPIAKMFGYMNDLRNTTSGKGSFTMGLSHYDRCPKNVTEEVVGEKAKKSA